MKYIDSLTKYISLSFSYTISLNKKNNEIYFSKIHSNYCDNLNKTPLANIEDINNEIFKKEELITKLTEIYENNNFISIVEFSKEAIKEYNNLKYHFNITTNTWKNIFNKIKNLNKKNNIDLILKNTTTIDGYQFFRTSDFSYNPFIKDNNISKYIIWSSDFNILRIKKNKHFFIDGTFVRTYGFLQTIIFMYYDSITKIFAPGIFILVNTKNEISYNAIFKYIIDKLLDRHLSNKEITITCDFEKGLINSLQTNFKTAKIIGCYFHYMKALIRQAKKMGYMKKNNSGKMLDLINRHLSIIPFKYNGNLKNLEDEINKIKESFLEFNEYFSYYEGEWFKFFSNNVLKYKDIPKKIRTNNALESLNNKIKNLAGKKIITMGRLYLFIKKIRK